MAKYLLYPIILVALTLSLASAASCAGRGDIVSIRAGEHSAFHRLVIELREKAVYKIKKTGKTIEIDVINVDSHGLRGAFAGTGFFRLRKVSTVSKDGLPLTTFLLTLNGPAEIRDEMYDKPYRIIVDMYPEKNPKHRLAKKKIAKKPIAAKVVSKKKVKKKVVKKKTLTRKKAGKKTISKKETIKKSTDNHNPKASYGGTFAFNEGWRWIYRKMAVERLKETFYRDLPDHGLEMLREFVPVKGGAAWVDGMEARAYVKQLEEHGETAQGATLNGIISLLKKDKDLVDAEREIIKTPENNLTPMARFLLASAYEREGLYPEAAAYYGMAYGAKTEKKLKARAALGRGRALFFSGRVSESLKWFEKAGKEGSQEAFGWLAGGRLLKGEFRSAWKGYQRPGLMKDPITLMGLGDLKMKRGDYDGAGLIFKGLRARFMNEPFLGSFFAIREGDALLASGSVKEGIAAYSSIKRSSSGEGLTLSNLALADYYSGDGNKPLKAKALYKEVAKSRTRGSGEAFIRLAEVLEGLKEHGEAMKTLEEISPENTISTRREKADFLRSRIAYNWIVDLYAEKKWFQLAMVNYRYGDWISFGKRAGNYLRVGEALLSLGLTPDAVKALNRAEKIGSKDIKVKAVLLLSRLYLDQRDGRAAESMLEDLKASSPEVAGTSKWQDYYLEAQYLKGNYREVLRLGRGREEGRFILMEAASYQGLGMWSEAIESYSRAIGFFKKNQDRKGLMEAETGVGDTQFASREFLKAIEAYSLAADMAAKVSTDTESWARYRLSLSYAGAGMREDARDALRELKSRDSSYGAWAEAISMAQSGGS